MNEESVGEDTPLFAVMSVVSTADSRSSFVSLVPSLDHGAVTDLGQSIEFADASYLFGTGTNSRFYVFRESGALASYDVSMSGEFVPGPELSFANEGIVPGSSERSIIFINDQKAYLLDDLSLQAVVWNPTDMSISGRIDLSALGKDGWVTYFDYQPKMRGAELVLAAYYMDENFSTAANESALAVIDTNSDAATITRDTRCGGFSTSVVDGFGDVYVASDPYVDALHRTAGESASGPGCILRVRAGETQFDPNYFVKVSDVTDGFGGGIVRGPGTQGYVRVYDETLEAISADTTALDLYGRAAWRWWRVDLQNPTQGQVSSLAPGAGTLRAFEVDGSTYATDASADYATTTLINMSAAAEPQPGLMVPGNVAGAVRVR